MNIVMRATLHDPAPNTYYGQWLAENARKHAAKRGAIARNETVASAGFVTFDVPERDFPGNRSPARWKFICRPKTKICAPGELTRFQRRLRRSPLLSKATAPRERSG
jgi:hypothetical protein